MYKLLTLGVSSLLLAGCAAFNPPVAGTSQADVLTKLGKPSFTHQKGNTTLFEYAAGPFSQYSYMARLEDGKLVSYEQTWTLANFQTIQIDHFTKEDVLHLVGHPTEVTSFARSPYEVWNYGFKESGVWNSMMSIYFDDQGIVRKKENGPDLRYEEKPFPF